jgi:hypothetical protein
MAYEDIYRMRKETAEETEYIYASIQKNSAAPGECRGKMTLDIIISSGRNYTFEMDVLFCEEAGILFITDFFGWEMYQRIYLLQDIRPHYYWIWKMPMMDYLKNTVKRIGVKVYGLRAEFYNKGRFKNLREQIKTQMLNKLIPFSSQLPPACLAVIGRKIIPSWFVYRHHPERHQWMAQRTTLETRRIMYEKHRHIRKEICEFADPSVAFWEGTQMIVL